MHMSKDLENKQEHVKLQNLSWIIQCW